MDSRTLLLTNSYAPHKVIHLDRAISMLFLGKIDVVEEYDEILARVKEDRLRDFPHLARAYKRSAGDDLGELVIRIPSVASLVRPIGNLKRGVKFSRINVFTRDGYRCQYCGEKKLAAALNYDHVIPRHRGGKTAWENIVASCYPCNGKKSNRAPEEAGMRLRRAPYKPKSLPIMGPKFDPKGVPAEWIPYVNEFFGDPASTAA